MDATKVNIGEKQAGLVRLMKSQRRFKVGDRIKVDPECRINPEVLELLNEFGIDSASAIFEVVAVQEPLGGSSSNCPQNIVIILEGDDGEFEQSSNNFILAG